MYLHVHLLLFIHTLFIHHLCRMLEALWADGVHSYRSETDKVKVKEVAAATGLVAERVKV